MKITINGVNADIQPENEKTVGEILAAMETWLAGSGHRLSGFSLDGEAVKSDSMEMFFNRELAGVKTIDIITSSLPELIMESLLLLIQDIEAWELSGFDGKAKFAVHWKESPEANLLAEQAPDLYDWTVKTFSGEGLSPEELRFICEERLRELKDPAGELGRTGQAVTDVCGRLEQLPLDIQTGKDAEAAGTVNIFSGVTEKVFRIFRVLKMQGVSVDNITVADTPITVYITEFGKALDELLNAYKQRDTVLVGDIAEYEMAPRLCGLYSAIYNAVGAKKTAGGD